MEILAPCGGYEHIEAAVRSGADAVYLGAKRFSARGNASNFSPEEMDKAVAYCHQNDTRVYLAVNTLLYDNESGILDEILCFGAEIGVDALIVQDLGVADYIKSKVPNMPLHASTQASIHTPAGMEMARRLGFERVVLARELTKHQIEEITRISDLEVEVFVHGALCGGVSGQCYFSSALGTRSGNRGLCAQPCRLNFQSGGRAYVLSLKDLSLVERINELKDMRVSAVKIEGRMKSPEYVAGAVTACRMALAGEQPDMEALSRIFSRDGFTQGYFDGNRKDMSGIRRKGAESGSFRIPDKMVKRRRINVYFAMGAETKACLKAYDSEVSVITQGRTAQAAVRHESTEEEVRRQLDKLGGSIFELDGFEADIDKGVMLPLADINAMRRDMIKRLYSKILEANTPRYDVSEHKWEALTVNEFEKNDADNNRKIKSGQVWDGEKELRAECNTWEQWENARRHGVFASLPVEIVYGSAEAISPKDRPDMIISADRWMGGRENEIYNKLVILRKMGFIHLLCHNIAHIEMGNKAGFINHGGWGLNITNTRTLDKLKKMGLSDAVLSFELTIKQYNRFFLNRTGLPTGIVVYGNLPLMVLTRCPVSDGPIRKDCKLCKNITDRTGRRFELSCNGYFSEILNADTLQMADKLNEIKSDYISLIFRNESGEETSGIIMGYKTGGLYSPKYTRGLLYRGVQ